MRLIILLIGLLLLIIKVAHDYPVATFVLATLTYHTTAYLLKTASNITFKRFVAIVKTKLRFYFTEIKNVFIL